MCIQVITEIIKYNKKRKLIQQSISECRAGGGTQTRVRSLEAWLFFRYIKHGHYSQRPVFKLVLGHEQKRLREDRLDDLCAHPLQERYRQREVSET
jgi:hypothetical protein